jgi:uncharacterized delta-60 repeat protein
MSSHNTIPTFSIGDGKVTTEVGKTSGSNSIAIQKDGKILAAGYTINSSGISEFALTRYNSNGNLDSTFNTDGVVTTQFDERSSGQSVAIQSDGKILVAGGSGGYFALARYNLNGTLDTSFGGDGIVTTRVYSPYASATCVKVQSDGKILVSGFDNNETTLTRYNSDGSLDTTFDTDGILTNHLGLGGSSVANSIEIQTDGKILVTGYATNASNNPEFILTRYNINGSLDTTFDTDGIVTTAIGTDSRGQSVTIQTDGKIIVAGSGDRKFALTRYNNDGSLDNTFDADGIVTTPVGSSYSGGESVAVQSDGKILVAGNSRIGINTQPEFALTRYNNDGSLDTTFGIDGIVMTHVSNNYIGALNVAIQADGKIVVTGGDTSAFTLIRYNTNGNLDISFDSINTLTDAVVATNPNTAVLISQSVGVIDAELYAQDNYNNSQLLLQRHITANIDDIFIANYPISFTNGVLSYLGTSIGVVTQSNGKLNIIFNNNATQDVVNKTLRSLMYINVGNNASEKVALDWTFSDGNTGSQGSGGVGSVTGTTIVNITDLTPPSALKFSPASYSTNVALNSDIVLTFSEVIQLGTGNIILKNSIGTVIATYNAENSQNLNITGNTLTINPSSDLAFSTRYFVEIATGSVKDLSGNSYLGTSAYEFTTTALNNPPTGSITITGNPIQGKTLTTSGSINDIDGMGTLTGQWFRDGFAVTGATDVLYTLTQADVGKSISATAYYTDGLGKLESINSNEVKIANINDAPIGNVTISGTATQNQILTANNTLTDLDGLGAISYQWLSNNKEISNATQSTYKPTQSDVGNVISVKASYTDGFSTKESVTSTSTTKVGNVNDPVMGTLSISGLAAQGQTLTTVNTLADLDGLGTIKYQWLSNGAVISGATKSSYVLGASDAGKTISVKANYTDLLGTIESVTSLSTDAVISTKPSKGNDVLTGTAKNDTLSALAGNDILTGGLGADKLTGGLGADIFKYMSIDDSGTTTKTRDTITDFKHSEGDKIDLSAIDADSILPLDQVFKYIGTNPFGADARAQLRLDPKTGILYGSTNADNTPEFSILLSGVKSLVPEDFIL